MRFKDWAAEMNLAAAQREILEAVSERRWYLGDIAVGVRPYSFGGDSGIAWFIEDFIHQPGSGSRLPATKGRATNGYYYRSGIDNGRYSSSQLRRVADCVAVAEAWVAGEIDSLPTDAPDHIQYVAPTRPDGWFAPI